MIYQLLTESVPNAEDRRPENGNASGDRPHWVLTLMRPTAVLKISMRGARVSEELVKIAACWPYGISSMYVTTSEMSS